MSVNELGAQSTNDPKSLIGSVFNITNNTNPNGPLIIQSTSITNTASVSSPSISPNQRSGINWLQVCRTPIVDMAIAEPCESLTTPGGYSLTPEGNRVLACVLGAGILLAYNPTGVTLGEAQAIAKKTGICG